MSLLESPVHIVRESISVVTQILSSKNIPVYQRGLEAYVAYDPITGGTKHVCLPYLPDNASDQLVFAVQGFLDHEVGHILFTDSKSMMAIAHDSQLMMMHNVFEDPFVEKGMRGKFTGTANNLNKLFEFFIESVIDKNFKQLLAERETNPLKFFSVLAPAITRAWHGVFAFEQYMSDGDKWKYVKPLLDILPKDVEERTLNATTTQDNIDLARDVLRAIAKGHASLTSSSGDDEDDCDSSMGDMSGDSSKSGKSKSDGIRDEEGDAEEGDTEKSEPSDEEGDEEEDESSDGDGKDGESSDEDEGKDEGGGKGEGSSDDSDDEAGSETGNGAEDDEEQESGETESESIPDADETEDGGESDDGSKETVIPEVEEREDIPDLKVSDMESSIASEISKMIVAATSDSEYSVFTTDFDEVAPPELESDRYTPADLSRATEDMVKKAENMASVIQADLQRAFISENRCYWQGAQHSGRINGNSLSRLFVGDARVFKKKVEHRTQDYDVSIVIDCSGSMNSRSGDLTRQQSAMIAAYTIGSALDAIGVNFELIGFTTKEGKIPHREVADAEDKIGRRYSRTGVLFMPIFKSFDEQWSPEVWRRLAVFTISTRYMQENADGECVMIAAKRLMAQKSSGKAMLVLSDGQPSCYGECGGDMRAQSGHLRKVVNELTEAGIKTFGIGIQSDAVRSFYPNHAVLTDIRKLPEEVVGRVSDMLLGG